MAKCKYRIREHTPKTAGQGPHSVYAEAVINNEIDNVELSQKIAARTGFKAYECQAMVAAIADVVAEEVREGNRVYLSNEKGVKMVSLYPKVSGGLSDLDVQQNPEKYGGATVATEEMLTPDMLDWTIGATVGIRFSKEFALNKQIQKVKFVAADSEEPGEDDTEEPGGGTENPGGEGGEGGNGGGTGGGHSEEIG